MHSQSSLYIQRKLCIVFMFKIVKPFLNIFEIFFPLNFIHTLLTYIFHLKCMSYTIFNTRVAQAENF